MLLNLIRAAQDGDQNDMLLLIQKFSPILKKYGKMLKYEDAINDLTLYFIELIHQFDAEKMSSTCDGAIIKYIAKCIYHFYLKLRKKAYSDNNIVLFDDLSEAQKWGLPQLSIYDDVPFEWIVPANSLTEKERMVIYLIYDQGYSATEIAKILGVSRQNINQIKKRAELKIRCHLYI